MPILKNCEVMDFAGRFGFSVKFVSYFVWGGISGSFLYPLAFL